jgi:hypothetical protein
LLALLLTADLRMLSVWSPTFATALLEPLLLGSELSSDPSSDPDGGLLAWLEQRLPAARRSALRRALEVGDCAPLWPALEVVSCWADGPSKLYAARLAARLPQARLVPKGLFATEGVVSIPWGISGLNPLAIDSHVLEFSDSSARILPAHELVEGQRYEPLLTTSGGLYRYRLGDVVEVSGFLGATPCVRYCGRSDARCDLVGEKLDATLAADACAVIAHAARICVLVPMPDTSPPGYLLIVESSAPRDAAALAAAVEARLMQVFHYGAARRASQLAPLAAAVVPSSAELLTRAWEALGRRAGDFKPAALIASLPYARAVLRALDDSVRP